MKTHLSAILIFISLLLYAQTGYLKLYSGAYNIMVGNDGSEAYALKEDGTCTWIFGWSSNGKVQTQKKYGTWSAKEGYIRISISGNTGSIIEEYVLKNGRFVSKDYSSRYLKKQ